MSFVHLRVHSEYSLSDSIIKIQDLVSRAHQLGMPAVGLTDYQYLFGAIKFYSTCLKFGVKPIIGVEAPIENENDLNSPFLLVLLCQHTGGYRSMCSLLSKAENQSRSTGTVSIKKEWLTTRNCEGLIALSGTQLGEIGQHLIYDKMDNAVNALHQYQQLFPGRFYLDLSRIGNSFEQIYEDAVLDFAETTNTPIVATHQPRFIHREEFELHEIKTCIYDHTVISDKNRRRDFTEIQYFCSAKEMQEFFSDLPEAIENSVEIAKRCSLKFDLYTTHMPAYTSAAQDISIEDQLTKAAEQGLSQCFPKGVSQEYQERLESELEIIRTTNFAGYFMIVSEIIRWAKDHNIPVGPGRGSGAGSLVAYCLNITEIDPLEHGLIFERFLNPERVSPPDFDIDFCVEQRDQVIEFVSEQFGKDQVAQIITYNKMAARAAVKDIGRAIRPDYKFYDQLAKMIPRDLDITLSKALERSSAFKARYDEQTRTRDLIDTAQKLEGMIRNVSKHPGGVVISPSRITDFSALIADKEGGRDVTHFDKDDLEAIGLVKFDFLGLTTLTTIAHTLQAINERKAPDEPVITEDSIPLDDEETYKYISTGKTIGIFQLESYGMQRLIRAMQPREFSDLVDLLALFRPGPLRNQMDQMYLENRSNSDYAILHPDLKDVLGPTNGIILYQEQVMEIARTMAGYTLGEADILRWAMGKKVESEMQKQRERFVSGSVNNGYDKKLAAKVYDLMESFGGYGFNKSHSVAYAMLAYRTAYLKTHHKADFYAASMSVDRNIDSIIKLFNDARSEKIEFASPDINESVYKFKALDKHRILYGLGAIKKIGSNVVDAIVEARSKGPAFSSIFDFCQRVDLRNVSLAACQALVCGGAFDSIDPNRAKTQKELASAYGIAQKLEQEKRTGQMNLFGNFNSTEHCISEEDVMPWSRKVLLQNEFKSLGLYFSGHPYERFEKELRSICTCSIENIASNSKSQIVVGGWVTNLQLVESKRGGQNAFFEMEDSTGSMSVVLYSEAYAQIGEKIINNKPIIVRGDQPNQNSRSDSRFVAKNAIDLKMIRQDTATSLTIELKYNSIDNTKVNQIKNVLSEHNDGIQKIRIEYVSKNKVRANFRLGDEWKVSIKDKLIDELSSIVGENSVRINYPRINWVPI